MLKLATWGEALLSLNALKFHYIDHSIIKTVQLVRKVHYVHQSQKTFLSLYIIGPSV